MNKLFLSETMLAQSFWTELQSGVRMNEMNNDLDNYVYPHAESMASLFPSQTGSISRLSSELLWRMARYFEPQYIAEVGTYIGRSTLSLFYGARNSLLSLDTCDLKYDTWRAPEGDARSKIKYHGKTRSRDMLEALLNAGKKIDLFLIDGQIVKEDIDLIAEVGTPNSVYLIDDFEGVEKGVLNVYQLRERFPNLILLAPDAAIGRGWNDAHCLAVLVPSNSIQLTRQQRLPVAMM